MADTDAAEEEEDVEDAAEEEEIADDEEDGDDGAALFWALGAMKKVPPALWKFAMFKVQADKAARQKEKMKRWKEGNYQQLL